MSTQLISSRGKPSVDYCNHAILFYLRIMLFTLDEFDPSDNDYKPKNIMVTGAAGFM